MREIRKKIKLFLGRKLSVKALKGKSYFNTTTNQNQSLLPEALNLFEPFAKV